MKTRATSIRYVFLILFPLLFSLTLLFFHRSGGDDSDPTITQLSRLSDTASEYDHPSEHFIERLGQLPVSPVVDQVSDSALTAYVTRLEEFRTRYTYTDSVLAASSYLKDMFTGFGYTEVSFDSFSLGGLDQRNVVAVKPGTRDPDRVIIVGGHYDSAVLPQAGCDPDTLAPGADDNASGVAVAMETARVLASIDTDLTVIFVAFAAEEQGLFGSTHYAEEAFGQGMDIRVVLNMDEVGHAADPIWDTVVNTGYASSPYIHLVADIAIEHTDLIPVLSFMPIPLSDHHPFHVLGYDYVLIHDGDESPHIHQCSDTIDNMVIPLLTDITRMITGSTLYLANMPEIPAGLDAVNVGDGSSLFLSWDPNQETDLGGYNIYYSTQPGSYDSLATVGSAVPTYTLNNLEEGTTFYVAVSAFDIEGYESPLTGGVEITVSARPQPPTGLSSASLETSVVLEWDRSTGELDIAGYNVYRHPADDPPALVLLGFVDDPETTFTDDTAALHTLYSYQITALDTEDPPNESDLSEAAFGRLATHDMGILVIDNTRDGTGSPMNPTDEEVDVFYTSILRGFDVRAHWDVSDSASVDRSLMDYDTGVYSSIVWHGDVRNSQAMAPDTTTMRKYLDTGGNIWFSGWMLVGSLTGKTGPSFVFGPDDFISVYMGIDSARTTSSLDVDFVGAEGIAGAFQRLSLDTEKVPLAGLFSTDVVYPPFEGTYPIYSYISSDSGNSPYHGLPVGLTNEAGGYGLVVTDFPLYFMEEADARSLAIAVMDIFSESVGIEDGELSRVPVSYALSQNFPNPFNPMTTITFAIPGGEDNDGQGYSGPGNGGSGSEKIPVKLSIFDLRGRRVKTLIDHELSPGWHQVTWDGRNENGSEVPSGIYFYQLTSGSNAFTRKMTLAR